MQPEEDFPARRRAGNNDYRSSIEPAPAAQRRCMRREDI